MPDITYEITQEIGVLSDKGGTWAKELNMVSWSGRTPVYDLRPWTDGHERMGKGITMTKEEIKALRDILNGIELD